MEGYSEEELLYLMRCGNEDAKMCLYHKYVGKVRQWIKPLCYYNYLGLDLEDFVQVSMSNFFIALDSYRTDQNTSISHFVRIAITRRIMNMTNAGKDIRIYKENKLISLDDFVGREDDTRYEEIIPSSLEDMPSTSLIIRETEEEYMHVGKAAASKREWEIMQYIFDGYGEEEVAEIMDISIKSVYNAVYRYRQKVKH